MNIAFLKFYSVIFSVKFSVNDKFWQVMVLTSHLLRTLPLITSYVERLHSLHCAANQVL